MPFKSYTVLIMLSLLYIADVKAQSFAVDTADQRIPYFRSVIKRNEGVVGFIEYTLSLQGIPKALRNLAVIESGLNNKSISAADAAGTWQLTKATGTYYGIKVTNGNDERYDLYKSTFAAAKCLTDLYSYYNNWQTVVAAYNCGKANVDRAIKKAGSSSYFSFYRYLPAETIEHVRKFLVACYATNELQTVTTFTDAVALATDKEKVIRQNIGEQVVEMEIKAGYDLGIIAEKINVPEQLIRLLNPGIEEKLRQDGYAMFALPVDKMPDFLLQRNEILNLSISRNDQ